MKIFPRFDSSAWRQDLASSGRQHPTNVVTNQKIDCSSSQ
jgi:hypothetical protein